MRSICWHAESIDPSIASVRLRVLQPIRALQQRGYDVAQHGQCPSDSAVMVFSKSDSVEALSLAQDAARQGRAIIYDICDNIFERPSANDKAEGRKERTKALIRLADVVTCTTEPLAQLLTDIVPEMAGKVEIIPDALEEPGEYPVSPSLFQRLALWRLRSFLRRHPGALHLVWFGKCKKGFAGIEHLQPVVDLIARTFADRPATLTVISNRYPLYRRASAGWRIPKFYLPWSLATFDAALRLHDAAVIPVEENAYTIGKTINRPATALMAGLGVIADPLPAYEELRPYIFLGEWNEGLTSCATQRSDPRIAAAQAHLRSRYGLDVVADHWAEVIDRLLQERGMTAGREPASAG